MIHGCIFNDIRSNTHLPLNTQLKHMNSSNKFL